MMLQTIGMIVLVLHLVQKLMHGVVQRHKITVAIMVEITAVEVMTLMETVSLTQTMLALMSHQPQKTMPIVMAAQMVMVVTVMVTEMVEAMIQMPTVTELLMTMITVLTL